MTTIWITPTQLRPIKVGNCTEVPGIGCFNEAGVFYWSNGSGRQFIARFTHRHR